MNSLVLSQEDKNRMSGGLQQSLFFLGLPDLKNLCCVTLSLQEEEPRSKQMKTCRELVLLYSDILASPALDSFNEITVVMAITFFRKSFLQAFGQRRNLQLGSPQCVSSGVVQCCLSYSLIIRLAPSWNKAGLYLISGKDFLTDGGRLNAVSMELSTSKGQLCISIEANTVRLPPTTLEDFGFPPLVLRRFCSDPDSVLDPASTGGAMWCHVLPSMKKGQIITISRQLPKDGPFRTYSDLQNHWHCLYGYRLPVLTEEAEVYCSIYFRPVGERLFTYPLSCVRLQPVQRCPRADVQGALRSFLSDIRDGLQSVCGFPARLTSKPCYHTTSLNSAASPQASSAEQVNLTTSFSIRPILTQLPAPPPLQPARSSVGSQPSAWTPLSQQAGAQRLLGSRRGFGDSLTQGQACRRDKDGPSSLSSSRVSYSVSSGYHSAPSLSPSPSSSSLPLYQPVSSLTSSSFSSVLPPLHPPVNSTPKLVPIFRNKHPSHHVNVALLRLQKQKEQLSRGDEERGRMTLTAIGRNRPSSSTVPSLSSLPISPPPTIPRFNCQPSSSSNYPKLQHITSLSPSSKPKPGLMLTPKPETKFKPKTNLSADAKFSRKVHEDAKHSSALTSSDASGRESGREVHPRVVLESKQKKSRAAIRDVDVEKMARSNQLSRLNSAALLSWLKGRGVLVSAKHKKAELMLKVMSCLAEV